MKSTVPWDPGAAPTLLVQGRAGHPGVVTYCKDRNSPILRTKSLNTEGSHTKRVLTHKEGNIWQTVLSNRTLQCWKHSLCLSVGH